MMLTANDISEETIVIDPRPQGQRPSTYDATVGSIIQQGREIKDECFQLPPRGIVWVVSNEIFSLPGNVTGLATLRTTWTHDGVLALNVGVVDPRWQGPLAAAIVNFGNSKFEVRRGEPFLRIMFHRHETVRCNPVVKNKDIYKREILAKSKMYSSTFLNMESLVPEVAQKVLSMPRWLSALTIIGLILAVLAIFAPISWSVFSDYRSGQERISRLESEVSALRSLVAPSDEELARRISELEARVEQRAPEE